MAVEKGHIYGIDGPVVFLKGKTQKGISLFAG